MIAFSHLIFALIYHSCAVQMLEKVIGYFLSLKNDCCRKHDINGIVTLAIGVENGKVTSAFWYDSSNYYRIALALNF